MNFLKIIFLYTIIIFSQCGGIHDNVPNKLLIDPVNTTAKKISYLYPQLMDTSFSENQKNLPERYIARECVKPHQVIKDLYSWRIVFNYLDSDTLNLFFFDIDTIQKYGWDKVRTDYKILARYDLTMENIIDLEGIVPYPLQDSTVKIYYPEGLNPFED